MSSSGRFGSPCSSGCGSHDTIYRLRPASPAPPPRRRLSNLGQRDIAIVGMACRFPLADDVDAYWRNIRAGRVCFSEIPKDRWDHGLYYASSWRETDQTYTRKIGLVDDVCHLGAMHCNAAHLRVRGTDPQDCCLLDAMKYAWVDGGYEGREFPRKTTGVFVGASVSEHKDFVTSRLRAPQILSGQFGRVPANL